MEKSISQLWTSLKPRLFGLVGTVTMINALVAILAFIKDLLLATALGTSIHADSLTIAYFLPDTIGNNLLAASLATACVPVFSKLFVNEEIERLWRCARSVILVSFIFCFLLTLFLFWKVDMIAGFIAGGGTPALAQSAIRLLVVMLPMIVLSPLLYTGFAMLQATGKFAVPAGSWLALHIVVIAVAILCMMSGVTTESSVRFIAAGITIGTFAMTGAVWIHIYRKTSFRLIGPLLGRKSTELFDIFRIFWPYLLILFATQFVYFIERKLASGLEAGTVAGLNYAFRLSQFPIWVFVAAVSSVVLPSMSKDMATGRTKEMRDTFSQALRTLAVVTVPTTFIFNLLGIPIVTILFQRGAFNEHSVMVTCHILQGYSFTMIGAAVSMIGQRYYLAAERPYTPLIIVIISSLANVAADYALTPYLSSAGIGYGAAIGASINALLILGALQIELSFNVKRIIRATAKLLLSNTLPFALVWTSSKVWGLLPRNLGFVMKAGYLGAVIALCALIYYWSLKKTNMLSHY